MPATSYTGVDDDKRGMPIANDIDYTALGRFERVRSWSVTGDIGYNLSPDVVLHAVASYARLDNPSAELDLFRDAIEFDTWSVALNGTWTIVKDLTLAVEGSYEARTYDNEGYFTKYASTSHYCV